MPDTMLAHTCVSCGHRWQYDDDAQPAACPACGADPHADPTADVPWREEIRNTSSVEAVLRRIATALEAIAQHANLAGGADHDGR